MKDSTFYQSIADISRFLEQEISPELYTVMDGGETLEICDETLQKLRKRFTWRVLEGKYSQAGGYICPVGDDSWMEVALWDTNEVQQSFQQQLESAGVPTNQASKAADVLAMQTEGELPVLLAEGSEELHVVRSAYSWMVAKQNS